MALTQAWIQRTRSMRRLRENLLGLNIETRLLLDLDQVAGLIAGILQLK